MAATDPDASGPFPALIEYLTLRVLDGQLRETATLLLFAEEGLWKLCLNDREAGMVLFRSGETIMGALESLEAALTSPRADWRPRRGK